MRRSGKRSKSEAARRVRCMRAGMQQCGLPRDKDREEKEREARFERDYKQISKVRLKI